ncbi:hypothetical protein B0T14DRAFT_1565 [Immersiella caudata]|uniref:Uncharacterized protein n=1 Tax=Immersiella caudata TaxID=314043 RepID=A0AA39XCC4_9PEZI|nr:hypothetical protein B0T14DRAFT_1565 [Immersiella caudata]
MHINTLESPPLSCMGSPGSLHFGGLVESVAVSRAVTRASSHQEKGTQADRPIATRFKLSPSTPQIPIPSKSPASRPMSTLGKRREPVAQRPEAATVGSRGLSTGQWANGRRRRRRKISVTDSTLRGAEGARIRPRVCIRGLISRRARQEGVIRNKDWGLVIAMSGLSFPQLVGYIEGEISRELRDGGFIDEKQKHLRQLDCIDCQWTQPRGGP